MSDISWRLQDAKAQFSAVVEAALGGEAQHVTRRGKRAVVVVAADDFARLQRSASAASPGFIGHLLGMPRETRPQRSKSTGIERKRPEIKLRDLDLG